MIYTKSFQDAGHFQWRLIETNMFYEIAGPCVRSKYAACEYITERLIQSSQTTNILTVFLKAYLVQTSSVSVEFV